MRCWFLAILFAATLPAQTSTEVEITSEPHHHLALENPYVRAFKVEIAPGEATLLHRHRHDFVVVTLGAAQIANQVEGRPAVVANVQDGQTISADGGMAHVVRNVGATPFRNVTIELLQDEKARKSPPPKWDEERGLNILERGTREILFVKDGVRVSEVELQPGGMIAKHHHAGPHLVVAITDLELHSQAVGKSASTIELKAGNVRWFSGGITHTVMNMSKRPAKYVGLEFH